MRVNTSIKKKKLLLPKQLLKLIGTGLARVSKMSFMERYAMFMGKVQLVELDLKHLAHKKARYTWEQVERWTLGTTIRNLEKNGLRPDFVQILDALLWYRNEIAHNLLANDALGKKLVGSRYQRISVKMLSRGEFELEQVIQVRDYLRKVKAHWFISEEQRKKVQEAKKRDELQYEKWLSGELHWSKREKAWVESS